MIPGVGADKLPKGSISVDPAAPEAGDDVTLSFDATPGQIPDPSTFTYQWYLNSNLLVGEVNSTLILTDVDEFDEGFYECYVTNANGTKIFNKNLTITSFYYLQPNGTDFYFAPDTTSRYLQPTPQPNVVLTDLQLWVDAGELESYPGTGSTWFDISGNNNDFTLIGGPTYSSSNGGILQFAAGVSYGELNSLDYRTQSFTIMFAARWSSGVSNNRRRVVNSRYNNWFVGHQQGPAIMADGYYAEGWIRQSNANDTNWRIYAATEDYANDLRYLYINDVAMSGTANAGTEGFQGLNLAIWQSSAEASDCEIGWILLYDRVLTAGEMTQNFNVYKDRYGL